uniref:Uncharacterized protein n=1 Tax=Brassica campestris TaxID=3711 RepID=A0A3P6A1R8_BRACM|nr:unnamed protein product [Brassica rapa]
MVNLSPSVALTPMSTSSSALRSPPSLRLSSLSPSLASSSSFTTPRQAFYFSLSLPIKVKNMHNVYMLYTSSTRS